MLKQLNIHIQKKKMKLDETPILFTKFDLKIDQDLSKNAKL